MSGLSKGQKTEVQNEIYKVLFAGGLLVTLIAGGVGYASGKMATSAKENDLKTSIANATTATSSAQNAAELVKVTTENFKSQTLVDGWPYLILCGDTRKHVTYKTYSLIGDIDGQKVYRHMWPDTGNIHDMRFNSETGALESVLGKAGKVKLRTPGCIEDKDSILSIIQDDRAFGIMKLKEIDR